MHEYALVQSLIAQVEEAARPHPRGQVRRVELVVGEQSGVDAELLALAYETFRERTVCDGAPLEIHRAAVRWACPRCREDLAPGARLRCPACHVPARMIAGHEILLQRIHLEVPDV